MEAILIIPFSETGQLSLVSSLIVCKKNPPNYTCPISGFLKKFSVSGGFHIKLFLQYFEDKKKIVTSFGTILHFYRGYTVLFFDVVLNLGKKQIPSVQ
jgi:hypothetical protein